MWIGFGLAFVHFLSIMMHASNPSIPTLGTHYDVGKPLHGKAADALRSLFLFIYNPTLRAGVLRAPGLCFSMWSSSSATSSPSALF